MVLAVALALLDFAPVFFLTLGLFFLAQLVDRLDARCRRMAVSGLVLVALGTLARASSNLFLAFSGHDAPLLATMMYVFGGPGFILMAGAITRARSTTLGNPVKRDPWIVPIAVSWMFLLCALYLNDSVRPDAWRPVLTLLAFTGTSLTALAAADLGWRRQLHMAALLFGFFIASSLTLIALHAVPSQPLLLQLVEVILNIASQAAFAFASWRVAAEYHARIGPTAPD